MTGCALSTTVLCGPFTALILWSCSSKSLKRIVKLSAVNRPSTRNVYVCSRRGLFQAIFSLEIRLNHHLREKSISVWDTTNLFTYTGYHNLQRRRRQRRCPIDFCKTIFEAKKYISVRRAAAPHKFSFPVKHICRCRENLVFCFISVRGCCALKNITWFFWYI